MPLASSVRLPSGSRVRGWLMSVSVARAARAIRQRLLLETMAGWGERGLWF